MLGCLFEGKCGNTFFVGVPEVLAHVHLIIGISILQHPLGDGCWCVFLICENAYLGDMFNEGTVKLWPRATSEGDDAHIVIGHHQPVSQHLQGIEGRIYYDFCFRHFSLDGVGKTEEERVTRSENDKKPPPIPLRREGVLSILLKDGIERCSNVNPLCTFWQQWGDYLMVAFASREHLAVFNDFQHFWWKPRLGIICYSYDDETQHIIRVIREIRGPKSQVSSRSQLFCIVESKNGIAERGGKIRAAFSALNDNLWNVAERLYHVFRLTDMNEAYRLGVKGAQAEAQADCTIPGPNPGPAVRTGFLG